MKHNFEKLNIWKDAVVLAVKVHELISDSKMYALRDQMLRSSVSVASNIAEGCERQSIKEFARYLNIAAGSAGEIRTQLIIAKGVGMLGDTEADEFIASYRSLSAQIYAFRNKINENN